MAETNHRPDDLREGQSHGLFVSERELRRRTMPYMGWDAFRATVREWERAGFPTIHKLERGRYWPACQQWLDSRYGVSQNGAFINAAQDGPENFDAPTRQSARVQTRAAPAAILDRQADSPRHQGIPGQVHPLAAGRR